MLSFSLLSYVEVGFLKGTISLSTQKEHTNLNAVVALALAGNQIKFNWADELGLGPG